MRSAHAGAHGLISDIRFIIHSYRIVLCRLETGISDSTCIDDET